MNSPVTGDPVLRLVDAEAGGDVSRVILDGAPDLEGGTVAAQCRDFARRFDHLRLKLIQPPHGELHMCPVLLLPPGTDGVDFGVIIMESMGYPPISGSNLFCAAAVALEHGFADTRVPETRLRVETPGGIAAVTARRDGDRLWSAGFENAPAQVKSTITTSAPPERGPVAVAVVSAGVDYAVVDAERLGVPLIPESHHRLVRTGRQVARAAGTDFTLFHDRLVSGSSGSSCRLAVFQSPGVICRSPTGTGTSAMLALAHARGWLGGDGTIEATSPAGNVFQGRILEVIGSSPAVLRTTVSGQVRVGAKIRAI